MAEAEESVAPVESTEREILNDIRHSIEGDENAVEVVVDPAVEKGGKEVHTLQKYLGVGGCISVITGTVLGSGIFGAPNFNVQAVDSLTTALIIWIAVGAIVTIGAICYVEIGVAYPVSGGDYSYMYIFYGPMGACMYLWASCAIIVPGICGIMALVASVYFIEACQVSPLVNKTADDPKDSMRILTQAQENKANAGRVLSIFLVCIALIIGSLSNKTVDRVAKSLLGIKIVAAFFVFSLAVAYLAQGNGFAGYENMKTAYVKPRVDKTTATSLQYDLATFFAIPEAIYACSFSYSGWFTTSFVVEELKNPAKTLPLGVYISMPIIVGIYVFLNLCYYAVLDKDEFKSANAVGSDLFGKATGAPNWNWTLAILIALCACGVLLVNLSMSSRISFVGARNRHFPKFFYLLNVKSKIPLPSLYLLGFMTSLYVLLGIEYLGPLVGATSYIIFLFNGLVVAGNIYWRIKRPKYPRPYKAPLVLHIFFVVFVVLIAIIPFCSGDWEFKKSFKDGWLNQTLLVSGVLFLVIICMPLYFLFIYWKWKGNGCDRALIKFENRTTLFFQKLFACVPEDETVVNEAESYRMK